MFTSVKYRIYPNKGQIEYLNKVFGCTRFIYNRLLADAIKHYEETGNHKINSYTVYKTEFPWLNEVDSNALVAVRNHITFAFKRFFTIKGVGFPKFKSKKSNYFSYTTYNNNRNKPRPSIRFDEDKLRLPKFPGLLKAKIHKKVSGRITSCTVSRSPSGKYYASIIAETEIEKLPTSDKKIGIDVGIKDFATFSDGTKIPNPKHLRKAEKNLRLKHQSLSRKKLASKNREKARLKVAKAYEKISNQRNDFLQKLTTAIIRENQSIAIEDLRIQNMMQNHNLAKAIAEVSWYEFRRMLEYKAERYGRTIVIAPSNYASSQLCSICDFKNPAVKELRLREWTCPECGNLHDRDINAAKNLERLIA